MKRYGSMTQSTKGASERSHGLALLRAMHSESHSVCEGFVVLARATFPDEPRVSSRVE